MVEFAGKIHGVPEGRPPRPEVLQCTNCEGVWMETRIVQMLQRQQVLIGQELPAAVDPPTFYVYKCLSCGHLNQPPLVYSGQTLERQVYDSLMKVINKLNDDNAKSE